MGAKSDITIYHNPRCGTSRTVLGLLEEAGYKPRIVEYLKTPPSRAELAAMIARMGPGARAHDVLRWKEPLAAELGLRRETSQEDELLDAMAKHPILIERPIVVSDKGNDRTVRLCRPSERVKEII